MYSFELPFPPSNNTYYRRTSKGMRISEKGRSYKCQVKRCMSRYGLANESIASDVHLDIDVYPPDKRKRDLDNLFKGVFDSLTDCGYWIDDSQVKKLGATMKPVDPNPRIEIFINVIGEYEYE